MKEAAIQEIFFIKKSKRKAQLSLLKTIAKEGEIKVGPEKSAFPPRETEKEVLAPEFQQSGPILYGKLCEIKFQTRKT